METNHDAASQVKTRATSPAQEAVSNPIAVILWGKLTPGGKFQLSRGEIYWIINYSKSPIYNFLQNAISWIIRLVSYRTKHKYIRQFFSQIDERLNVKDCGASLRSRFTDIS